MVNLAGFQKFAQVLLAGKVAAQSGDDHGDLRFTPTYRCRVLPLACIAHPIFMQASSAGYAREADSAVIKIFPGIELPKEAGS